MAKKLMLDKKMKGLSIEDDESITAMFKPVFHSFQIEDDESFQMDKKVKSKFTYTGISELSLLSEHWAELDFSAKNTEVTGTFLRDASGFSYTSNIADRLSIGAKVDFFFEDTPVRFEITEIENDKMRMDIAKKKEIKMARGYPKKLEIIVSDSCLRKGLNALEKVDKKMLKILFPISQRQDAFPFFKASSKKNPLNHKRLFNKQLNTQQIKCVERILHGKKSPQPFILFGPPGTGKSKTVCETIKQVWKQSANNFIIVTAHSNAAVDLLVQELISVVPKENICRIVSKHWFKSNMSRQLQKYSTTDAKDVNKMNNLRILCGTLQILGNGELLTDRTRVWTTRNGTGYRRATHIFVDEAGQSPETDILIPWTLFDPELKGQVVLSGDPHQLGPVVKSNQAKYLKHDISMLERFMEDDKFGIYQKDSNANFNENFVIQLTKNYRSHPDILKIPNELFYRNTLEPCASPEIYNEIYNLKMLLKPGFPMIFHSVHAKKHFCPKSSTSLANFEEVKIVMKYVSRLKKILPLKDVGIISPYKSQGNEIRRRNLDRRQSDVEVGSVEKFQGNEKKVIIISTVKCRGSTKSLGEFVGDDKRFNVAITRAKCLLIIVGDDRLLNKDKNWGKLIQFIKNNGGYIEHLDEGYVSNNN